MRLVATNNITLFAGGVIGGYLAYSVIQYEKEQLKIVVKEEKAKIAAKEAALANGIDTAKNENGMQIYLGPLESLLLLGIGFIWCLKK